MKYLRGIPGLQVMVFWGERALNLELKILDLNPSSAILSAGDYEKVGNLFVVKWAQ